ncbi:RnfABCDGE type electron transport complex subunit B [Cuneatibacter sp. NSJ-177]|uniref:RnfABCDGE type electron transport complex subunit B n=1 Tax=Cuneatibacter sp. NSJ-177 TaxID=2931401 RepID=UPI001FD1EC9A|nr:RnfABCDGE type electron transport complex subunit B [Cuneatibacter sp. NSJ-177]MCJ7834140.1 RnfABCDGE type electron transport complex subunit B [Cuneatibacter sp. NSJ-177]
MDASMILLAVAVVGGVGLLIGLLLGVAGKKFAVETDERVEQVREHLAGSNCGGCGFAGCDACAEAMVAGTAAPNVCAPAGAENAKAIGEILGVSVEVGDRKVAFVRCAGTCDKTEMKSQYFGIQDCQKASMIPGSTDKACNFGCMGFGSCVNACKYDAIHVVNGVAVVDKEKCVACGACTAVCPKNLIVLVPAKAEHLVQCSNREKGKAVKAVCAAGCIGCGICQKNCEFGAVTVTNNLASIDPEKCTNCGKCAEKCPVKVIS